MVAHISGPGPDWEKLVVCIGHIAPRFTVQDAQMMFVCERDIGAAGSWIFGEEYPDLMKYGDTLSEYSGLFALLRRIRAEGKAPRKIVLTQYRKFVTNKSIGSPSQNMPYVNTLPSWNLALSKQDFEPLVGCTFVSKPIDLQMRVIDQYAKVHVLRDLLTFVGDSIDRGTISNVDAKSLIDSRYLIPAPALGCYEGTLFVEIFSQLEQAAAYFLTSKYEPRSGYQRRVLGFCLERLHSYLLLRRLGFPKLQRESFGQQVVVSDSAIIEPTA